MVRKLQRQRIFLREWREHRGKTLVQVAEQVGITHGHLSRIERGQKDYTQSLLELLAEAYMCEPADLIVRNPQDRTAIWSLWDSAQEVERDQIVRLAETVLSFRQKDGTTG
jgi:transcriptional regulator with XRE-family HTH domain